MYVIKFGRGFRFQVQAADVDTARSVADALAAKGWGVHVIGPDGVTVPWKI